MNELENIGVQKNVHLTEQLQEIVQIIVQIRKQAKLSQKFIAEWLEVDRRKIIDIENGKCFDILLINEYASKLDIKIKLFYE